MIYLFSNKKNRLLTGTAVWSCWVAFQWPHPLEPAWARGVLLLAPLVIVPMGVEILLLTSSFSHSKWLKLVDNWCLPAAIFFALAYLLPPGWMALCLALPWILATAAMGWAGLIGLWNGAWKKTVEFCFAGGLSYIAVAGVWAIFDRTGLRPLDYDQEIVFLTIAHFHYAGFVLPLLTGLAVEKTGGIFTQVIGYLVVSGVALVAAGILLSQLGLGPDWEGASAWWMALSGIAVAAMHFFLFFKKENPLAVRLLWAFAATMLTGGMLLAGLYGTRYLAPVAGLDIPAMWALHGTANAMGFGFFATLGWWLFFSKKSPVVQERSANH